MQGQLILFKIWPFLLQPFGTFILLFLRPLYHFLFSFFSHYNSYHCRYYYGYPGLAVSLRYHCYLATILHNQVKIHTNLTACNYFATIGTKVSAPDMQPPFYLFYDYLRYDLTTTAPFLVSTIRRTDFNSRILKLPGRGGLHQRCHSLKTTLA